MLGHAHQPACVCVCVCEHVACMFVSMTKKKNAHTPVIVLTCAYIRECVKSAIFRSKLLIALFFCLEKNRCNIHLQYKVEKP